MNNIIYLDAAATALKPESVITAEMNFLRDEYANSGRGICPRAAAVDASIAKARQKVANFIGAKSPEQIIFTSGATDGLNRVVHLVSELPKFQSKKPMVAVSDLDHHSARLPWAESGADIVIWPLDETFNYDMSKVPVADVVVITAMSNVLGLPINVTDLIKAVRKKNPDALVIVDAAQYVVHNQIIAKDWDADFICFSGHKIGADTGVGVMYMKSPDDFFPDKFGGGMVNKITGAMSCTLNVAPDKFEAGTLPITQIIGLHKAIDYLAEHRPNLDLIKYLYDRLSKISRIKIITSRNAAMLTFYIEGMHVLDFGAIVGARGLCLRVGNMCAGWLHNLLGLSGTVRISVGTWNTMDDVRKAADIIEEAVK